MSEKISLPIAADQSGPGQQSAPRTRAQGGDVMSEIEAEVKGQKVFLYMKGTPDFPQCGFSGRAIQILKACGVDAKAVTTVNVLEDPAIRAGIKDYSNWPTIPQLYVKGEFIGGSDIMTEMYESGELQQVLTGKAA
jgi:monothiol glutaredoxin